jgi:hypothetical protein
MLRGKPPYRAPKTKIKKKAIFHCKNEFNEFDKVSFLPLISDDV